MNTTAAIFFLVLGQADGFANAGHSTSEAGGLAVIPAHYETLASCETAGEAARANNLGLSFLSYTCVPAEINVQPVKAEVKYEASTRAMALKASACVDVCEVRE